MVRVLILALLALMLPVRGVMAAAMLCPPSAGAEHAGHAMHAPADATHDHRHGDGHVAADAGTGAHDAAADDAAGPDTCNLCSACCSVPPLAPAVPTVPAAHPATEAAFPAPLVQSPSFIPDGPERPPRSF